MRPRLAMLVESVRKALRTEERGEVPRSEPPETPDRWKDPVPVMKDRDGHVHVLI